MADGKDIQIENGEFTRIHNAILEALAKARLSGAEFRCLMFLFRKTYGWGKKEDRISLSQWGEGMSTQRGHVLNTLNQLIRKNIILRRIEGGQIPFYSFNKYVEEWTGIDADSERGKRFAKDKNDELLPDKVLLPEQVTVTNTGNSTVTRTGNETVTNTGTHKRKKDTIKESSEHQKMFGALTSLCVLDAKLKGGQIAKTAKRLLTAEYTVEDISLFSTWWKTKDFRGLRGSPPTLSQVVDLIAQVKQEAQQTQTPHVPQKVMVTLPSGQIVEGTR